MIAFVLFSIPSEKSEIKGIAENAVVNVALGDDLSGFGAYDLAQIGKGAIAAGIELKDAVHDFSIFGMYFDVALNLVIAIADRGATRIDALRRFLLHALFDFLAQVLNVVTGHENLKAVHQFRLRLGIFVEDLALFGEMDFYA